MITTQVASLHLTLQLLKSCGSGLLPPVTQLLFVEVLFTDSLACFFYKIWQHWFMPRQPFPLEPQIGEKKWQSQKRPLLVLQFKDSLLFSSKLCGTWYFPCMLCNSEAAWSCRSAAKKANTTTPETHQILLSFVFLNIPLSLYPAPSSVVEFVFCCVHTPQVHNNALNFNSIPWWLMN